jgi:hypothetical protein
VATINCIAPKKNNKNSEKKINSMRFLSGKGGYFVKLSNGSKTSDMTSKGLGEVFEGESADMCAGKFPLVLMGGQANGQACADGERGPPSARAEIFVNKKRFC